MARIRTIKPEFWTSEQVTECSPSARLMFIGLLNFCDDSGVHPESIKRLKMEVFPSDDFTTTDMAGMVGELLSAGLLERYSVAENGYWRVTGWRHQKIDQPTFKHPLPDGVIPSNVRRKDAEDSPNAQRTVGGRSTSVHPRKGKEEEGNGEEGKKEIGAGSPEFKGSEIKAPETRTTQTENQERSSVARAEAKVKSSGSRIPHDWKPSETDRDYAKSKNVDADHEGEKFLDHWLSKAGSDGMKADWAAAWRTWVRNSIEFKNSRSGHVNAPPGRRNNTDTQFEGIEEKFANHNGPTVSLI